MPERIYFEVRRTLAILIDLGQISIILVLGRSGVKLLCARPDGFLVQKLASAFLQL